ncbi:MAG: cytochrome c [Opitutaceae bacterium]|jgi:mono/diheme cytochrome c family protein|nr:cytochrome c [Opitutaceae bacterium]
MRYAYITLAILCIVLISLLGTRGSTFNKPPRQVFPDDIFPQMTRQARYLPQSASLFFADGRADRPVPEGAIARDTIINDDLLATGKLTNGDFLRGFPDAITIDARLLARGQDRFNIYCQPCHGALGDGNGITKHYGMGATSSYHDDRLRQMPEGELFNTITHGKNTMLSYADKLTPQDRWAVVAYLRALQRAAQGSINDVPAARKTDPGLQ